MPSVDSVSSVPAVSAKESARTVAVLDELFKTLSVSKSVDETRAAANSIASLLNGPTDEQSVPVK